MLLDVEDKLLELQLLPRRLIPDTREARLRFLQQIPSVIHADGFAIVFATFPCGPVPIPFITPKICSFFFDYCALMHNGKHVLRDSLNRPLQSFSMTRPLLQQLCLEFFSRPDKPFALLSSMYKFFQEKGGQRVSSRFAFLQILLELLPLAGVYLGTDVVYVCEQSWAIASHSDLLDILVKDYVVHHPSVDPDATRRLSKFATCGQDVTSKDLRGRPSFATKHPEVIQGLLSLYEKHGAMSDLRNRRDVLHVPHHLTFRTVSKYLQDQFNVTVKRSTFYSLHHARRMNSIQARRQTQVINAKIALPTKDAICDDPDAHYTSALTNMYVVLYHSMETGANLFSMDDRAKIPTNKTPTARLLPVRSSLRRGEDDSLSMYRESYPTTDYDGTAATSIVPAGYLRLLVNTPRNRDQAAAFGFDNVGSLRGGQGYYILRGHRDFPSSHARHVDDLLKLIVTDISSFVEKNVSPAIAPHMLLLVDSGPDMKPLSSRALFMQAVLFEALQLDSLVVLCHEGGASKKNPVERLHSAPVRALSTMGVINLKDVREMDAAVRDCAKRFADLHFSGLPVKVSTMQASDIPSRSFFYMDPSVTEYFSASKSDQTFQWANRPFKMTQRFLDDHRHFGVGAYVQRPYSYFATLAETYAVVHGKYHVTWSRSFAGSESSRVAAGFRLFSFKKDILYPTPDLSNTGHYLPPHMSSRADWSGDHSRLLEAIYGRKTVPPDAFRPSALLDAQADVVDRAVNCDVLSDNDKRILDCLRRACCYTDVESLLSIVREYRAHKQFRKDLGKLKKHQMSDVVVNVECAADHEGDVEE